MKYIDCLIPLFGGIYLVIFGNQLSKKVETNPIFKKVSLKSMGWILIGIAILYFILEIYSR